MQGCGWDGAGGRARAGRRSRRHHSGAPMSLQLRRMPVVWRQNAPEGFGVGKGNGTRGQVGGSDMAFEARQQILARTLVQERAMVSG